MHVFVLILLVACLPAGLFALGCLAQIAVGRRPEAILAVPSAGFILAACAFVSHITGIPAVFAYLPALAAIAVLGGRKLMSGKMRIPIEFTLPRRKTPSCGTTRFFGSPSILIGLQWSLQTRISE